MEADTTETLFNFYGWLHENRKRVAAGIVVVVVVAASVALWVWHSNQNEAEASQELLALPLFSSVGGLGEHAKSDALANITRDYPNTIAGINAQLLAAKTSFVEGNFDAAQQAFAKFVTDHPGNELVPQAKVGVAASLEGQGKLNEALAKYKEVVASYSADVNVTMPVKLTLGRLSEALNKPDVAATYYEELARINNPYDPWVAEAGERLRLLFASHPELNPANAQKTAQPSLLTPSASEMQIVTPSTNTGATPKSAEAPKTPQNSPFLQMPTNLPPAAKP